MEVGLLACCQAVKWEEFHCSWSSYMHAARANGLGHLLCCLWLLLKLQGS